MEDSKIKCKGCPKKFPINQIQRHIKQSSCNKQYSQEEFNDIVTLCKSHTKSYAKRKKAENYRRKKDQKNIKVCYNRICISILDLCHYYHF